MEPTQRGDRMPGEISTQVTERNLSSEQAKKVSDQGWAAALSSSRSLWRPRAALSRIGRPVEGEGESDDGTLDLTTGGFGVP
jgi:hypothetical protein